MKLCIDCKYIRDAGAIKSCAKAETISPIDGHVIPSLCIFERRIGACGLEGKLWEEADHKETQ